MSAGWQKNFAETVEKKNGVTGYVSHFNVRSGEIVDRRRSVDRSLYERDYGTFWNPDGTPNRTIDDLFTDTEHEVIKPLRLLSHENVSEDDKRRIIDLFALHHARSTATRFRLRQMLDDVMADAPDRLAAKIGQLGLLSGQIPDRVEIEGHVREFHEADVKAATTEVGPLLRIRDDAVRFLSQYELQVVESPESFPGFVLGDVPVVNAKLSNLSEQRFGMRDRLKLNESDFIGGPLSRHQAVVFSREPAAHFMISNPELIATFNVQTLFAATELVVCHPDDVDAIKVLWEHREAFRTTAPLMH